MHSLNHSTRITQKKLKLMMILFYRETYLESHSAGSDTAAAAGLSGGVCCFLLPNIVVETKTHFVEQFKSISLWSTTNRLDIVLIVDPAEGREIRSDQTYSATGHTSCQSVRSLVYCSTTKLYNGGPI